MRTTKNIKNIKTKKNKNINKNKKLQKQQKTHESRALYRTKCWNHEEFANRSDLLFCVMKLQRKPTSDHYENVVSKFHEI